MKRLAISLAIMLCVFTLICVAGFAQGNVPQGPEKEQALKMIRFGKEAYLRGRYEEAKAYFKKAIEADPKSQVAWTFYDLSTVMALGKRVERQTELLATTEVPPPEKAQAEAKPVTPSQAEPKAPPPKVEPKPEFKIMHDEGC